MSNKILAAFDGTKYSEGASKYAIEIAKATNSLLVAVLYKCTVPATTASNFPSGVIIAWFAGVDRFATKVDGRNVASVASMLLVVEFPTMKYLDPVKLASNANEPTPALKVLNVVRGLVTRACTSPLALPEPGRTNKS